MDLYQFQQTHPTFDLESVLGDQTQFYRDYISRGLQHIKDGADTDPGSSESSGGVQSWWEVQSGGRCSQVGGAVWWGVQSGGRCLCPVFIYVYVGNGVKLEREKLEQMKKNVSGTFNISMEVRVIHMCQTQVENEEWLISLLKSLQIFCVPL